MNTRNPLPQGMRAAIPSHFADFQEPWRGFPHVLSIDQFDRRAVEDLISDALKTLFHLKDRSLISYLAGRNRTMVTFFFEASTRTRMSFERAAQLLGATCIHTESGGLFSSAAKGESLEDTARVVTGAGLGIGYGDILIVRHKAAGSAKEMASTARVPVINAGDGDNEHPTQAFLDLATMYLRYGRIDGLTIAMIGDIRHGRTIHSLARLLKLFRDITIVFTSPPELADNALYAELTQAGINVEVVVDRPLADVLARCDVAYFTRLQTERFHDDPDLAARLRTRMPEFSLTPETIIDLRLGAIALHPLPIADGEIAEAVKTDPRVWAFVQTEVGIAMRMALLNRIFRELDKQRMSQTFMDKVLGNMRFG